MKIISDSDEEPLTIQINQKYAKSYEKKKRKEEEGLFHHSSSSDESCSDVEDEDGVLLTQNLDAQIMKTILLLKSKDPIIYDKNANLIPDVPEASIAQPEKPFTIKHHHTRELLKSNDSHIHSVEDSSIQVT